MNNLIILAATAVRRLLSPELSLWSMIVKGGWLMIPIFILSIIAVIFFVKDICYSVSIHESAILSRIKSGIVFLPAIFVSGNGM